MPISQGDAQQDAANVRIVTGSTSTCATAGLTCKNNARFHRVTVGVAHFIKDCFKVLGALDDVPDDASISSSSALGGWIDVIHSFIHRRMTAR